MRFAIIGAGNMGGALARGLAKGSLVRTADITVSDPSRERTDALCREFPEMKVAADNKAAVKNADVVLFAVKPWLLEGVIEEVKGEMDYDNQVVVSIAGGVGTKQICQYLDRGDAGFPAVYYLIPNTAVDVMAGMTFMTSVFSTARFLTNTVYVSALPASTMPFTSVILPRAAITGISLVHWSIAFFCRSSPHITCT